MEEVFFLGGDRFHPPEIAFTGVGKALDAVGLTTVCTTDCDALSREALAGRRLLVILRDGMNWPDGHDGPYVQWMTDEQQQAIWDFVHAGGGFLPLHNSQGIYPPGGLYYELFGGDYGGHPAPADFQVQVVNPKHPITAGVEDYEIYDEQHMVKYYLGPEQELLRTSSPTDGEASGGWWREMGQGRLAYLSMGHTVEALDHPMTQRLLCNAIRWCLRMD